MMRGIVYDEQFGIPFMKKQSSMIENDFNDTVITYQDQKVKPVRLDNPIKWTPSFIPETVEEVIFVPEPEPEVQPEIVEEFIEFSRGNLPKVVLKENNVFLKPKSQVLFSVERDEAPFMEKTSIFKLDDETKTLIEMKRLARERSSAKRR